MREFILFVAASLISAPAMADMVAVDANLGHTMTEVKTHLVEMGYDVRKAEMEDGRIEVYVVKDGQTGEIYVDPASGKVTKVIEG
jgi:hypothetical protein